MGHRRDKHRGARKGISRNFRDLAEQLHAAYAAARPDEQTNVGESDSAELESTDFVPESFRAVPGRRITTDLKALQPIILSALQAEENDLTVIGNPNQNELAYIDRKTLYPNGTLTSPTAETIVDLARARTPEPIRSQLRYPLEVPTRNFLFVPKERTRGLGQIGGVVSLMLKGEELATERREIREAAGLDEGRTRMNRVHLATVAGDASLLSSLEFQIGFERRMLDEYVPDSIMTEEFGLLHPGEN